MPSRVNLRRRSLDVYGSFLCFVKLYIFCMPSGPPRPANMLVLYGSHRDLKASGDEGSAGKPKTCNDGHTAETPTMHSMLPGPQFPQTNMGPRGHVKLSRTLQSISLAMLCWAANEIEHVNKDPSVQNSCRYTEHRFSRAPSRRKSKFELTCKLTAGPPLFQVVL